MAGLRPIRRGSGASYIPLFWRIFVPNATVLASAGVVLAAEPANGRVLVLTAGILTMLAINLAIMRRSFAPLMRLAATMQEVDPLRPGQRVPVLEPPSEVTQVASAFNDMLGRFEEERRESARRELAAQHAVRRHVARELHDELGQNLTALGLQLDRMASGAVPDVRKGAADARDAALDAVETVRVLARQLRPEVLDDLGLRPALADLCSRLSTQTGLPIETDLQRFPKDMDRDTELVIYRVVQESLTNVMRHADASRARVCLNSDDEHLTATVEDDGAGMELAANLQQGGLRQMRERVLLVGGTLRFESSPGQGTMVELRIPRARA